MAEPPVLVCVSPRRWDSIWRSTQQYLSRLAGTYRIVLIEPAFVAGDSRLRSTLRAVKAQLRPSTTEVMPNVTVVSGTVDVPLLRQVLPARLLSWWAPRAMRLQASVTARHVRRIASRLHLDITVLWLHGIHHRNVTRVDAATTLYFVYDEFPEFVHNAPIAELLRQVDRELCATVDLVVASSTSQWEKRRPHARRCELVPNGVDFDVFGTVTKPAPELAEFQGPVVGYGGWIGYQLDVDLLLAVAEMMPDATLAMVGPVDELPDTAAVRRLQALPNVCWYGVRPPHELAAFMTGFDVGLIPYRLEGYVLSAYPLKLHEYFATGTPVVATSLPELQPFADEVDFADDPQAFVAAIRDVLARHGAGAERRIDVARENTWDRRVGVLSQVLANAVSGEREAL